MNIFILNINIFKRKGITFMRSGGFISDLLVVWLLAGIMPWYPTITRLKLASINLDINHTADNAMDILVPLDVDKYYKKRSVRDIVLDEEEGFMDMTEHEMPETKFKILDFDKMYSMYSDCINKKVTTDPRDAFRRYTQCHEEFKQFKALNKVLRLQDKVIFGMYIANIAVFNSCNPIDIGDWIKVDHPFISMGQAIYGNESFACRISTLGHAMLADQERYKQTIVAAVLDFEEFEELEGDDLGSFTKDQYDFYERMRNEKLDSNDPVLRDTSVRQLFLDYSPYVLAKYRGTKFTEICSKELQDWCFKLLRLDCRVTFEVIGARTSHLKRRPFQIRRGVNKDLFKNCMKIFCIIDQNVKESNYYDALFRVWNELFWGKYVNGQQLIVIQGLNVPFKESGGNEYSWGLVRLLIKLTRNKQHRYFMCVLSLHFFMCLLCLHFI